MKRETIRNGLVEEADERRCGTNVHYPRGLGSAINYYIALASSAHAKFSAVHEKEEATKEPLGM